MDDMREEMPDDWNDESEKMYQMALFASQVVAMAQRDMMLADMEVQLLESIYNMPAPEERL
jgi:hypothetical protein